MNFTELNLLPELQAALDKAGFVECTPIQAAVIPAVLNGKDVSGLAQTGTGKTGAFVIPLIERILRFRKGEGGDRVPQNWRKNSFVLVLVPTRELATQVEAAIAQFGGHAQMRSAVIVGGTHYDDQRRALTQGFEFIVGTPGRLLDLYKSHDLDLNSVGAIVFDEADRMFDMGFKDDMKFILRRVPRDRHFLLFSATLNFDVVNTAYQFGAEPMEFNLSRDQATAEGVDHEILHVGQEDKPAFLLSVLKKYGPEQCIVFSNFKHNVSRIARFLKTNNIDAIEMSSLLSQHQRNKVLEAFRSGKKEILVATDVAARGLDIKGIDLVVNYDLPDDPEGYVHRIGRTGRAGTRGKAIGLVSDRDVDALMRIETYLKEKVIVGWLDDTELIKEFASFPPPEARSPRQGRFQRPHKPEGPRSRPPHRKPSEGRPQKSHSGNGQHRSQTGHASTPSKPTHDSHSSHSHEHRDRRSGRHRGLQTESSSHPTKKSGPRHHSQGEKAHRHERHAKPHTTTVHRRPLKKTSDKSAGLGQKVKNFFTKLFR